MPAPKRKSSPTPSRRSHRPSPGFSPVTLHQLPHGLQLLVREDHSAPVVAVQAWCRTGSIHEGQWLGAGLSHVLEHMLFKGTKRRSGPRLDQEVTEAGGYFNAYTSFDRTVYLINAPSTGAGVALDVLADIMQNAALPADELHKELDVIRREMDMIHDDPGHRSSRRLFETAFTQSPCRHPIIGHRALFDQLRTKDIRTYYRQRYAPNNVFFVVVGDIDTNGVLDQLGGAYQDARSQVLPPLFLPPEPRQVAARTAVEEGPVALGYLHLCWHIPDLRHPDTPALDVLATLLGAGRSSRLHQRVRDRQGLVHSAEAWTYSPALSGVFGASAIIDRPNHDLAREALLAEVERLRQRPVTAKEMAKAKKQFTAAALATRKTMQGQAQDLGGSWLVADDPDFSERYLEAVDSLSPADLQRVASLYLKEHNQTHYALLPKVEKPAPQATASVSKGSQATLTTLPNGLRLILKEDHRLPFVEFRLVLLGGVLRENAKNNGLTSLLTRTLLKGTRKRSGETIAREIESVGGHIDSYGGSNSFGLQLEVLRPDLALGIDLLSDVLLHPRFPVDEVNREREIQLASIKAQEDQLLKNALVRMREELFGRHGYGLDPLGTEASASKLHPTDLRRAHQQWTQPKNAVLSVVGDFQSADLRRKLAVAFARWSTSSKLADPRTRSRSQAASATTPALRRVREARDKRQAVVVIGFPGTSLHQPDRFALDLIREACSDLGSRLFLRIRDELGLAYYVGAQQFSGLVPGYFAFYAGTSPSQAEQVETELLAEAARLAAAGLTQAELARVKAKILGHRKIGRQDPGSQALTMALDELYGLGYDHADEEDAAYQNVTLEEVRAAAQRTFLPERAVVVILSGAEDEDQASDAEAKS